jgi:hypothetical protein
MVLLYHRSIEKFCLAFARGVLVSKRKSEKKRGKRVNVVEDTVW